MDHGIIYRKINHFCCTCYFLFRRIYTVVATKFIKIHILLHLHINESLSIFIMYCPTSVAFMLFELGISVGRHLRRYEPELNDISENAMLIFSFNSHSSMNLYVLNARDWHKLSLKFGILKLNF